MSRQQHEACKMDEAVALNQASFFYIEEEDYMQRVIDVKEPAEVWWQPQLLVRMPAEDLVQGFPLQVLLSNLKLLLFYLAPWLPSQIPLLWTKLMCKEKLHRICLGHLLQPESSSKASASKYPPSLDNNHCHHSA